MISFLIIAASLLGLIIGSLITAYVFESVLKTGQIRAAQAEQNRLLQSILDTLRHHEVL